MPRTEKPEDVGLCSRRLGKVRDWMHSYVDDGKLPCAYTLVARHGKVALAEWCGSRDVAAGAPVEQDTIFRIYSMTKPVTSVAVMMLYEDGRFQLDDDIGSYIPELADMGVYTSGYGAFMRSERANAPVTIRQLLTHTSGLTYGFLDPSPVGQVYARDGLDFHPHKRSLADVVEALGAMPLVHQPGTRWNYSVSFDVLGRLVEVVSGQTLDGFFAERIFKPLGMVDTGFAVPAEKLGRFAALYQSTGEGGIELLQGAGTAMTTDTVKLLSGGGGLTSTVEDYFRFTEFLRCKGELDGVRLLGRKTVEMMTANHLGGDMASMGQPRFGESSFEGVGFGFGVSVMLDPAKANIMGTPGEYAWGGAASTAFWTDPKEDMTVIFATQLIPSDAYPLRRQLRVLTYQALID